MEARYEAIGDWYRDWVSGLDDDPAMASVLALAGEVARARVLDLGCGEGRVARACADRGASVTGIDLSATLLQRAQSVETARPRGISYFETDACTSRWWEGVPFDGVVSNMAVSDIDDLDAALNVVATVLRADGWFVFSIMHPCFPGTADKRPSWPSAGYFDERWWTTGGDGVRGRVGAHHRTLGHYLNSLVRAGLAIEVTDEPGYPTVTVPTWLTVRCRRVQPNGPSR